MKKLIPFLLTAAMLLGAGAWPASAAGEYAKYISSVEEDHASGYMDKFALWDGCQLPMKNDIQSQHKYDGKTALKLYCTDKEAAGEWHASYYWTLDPQTNGNWTGAQYLEFWIKNDTGSKLGLQIQFTERGPSGNVDGEPWRVNVKTKVFYEESGKFVERDSDVSNAEDYNEFASAAEGAIEVPKGYAGRIRIAINANNFRRAQWFLARPGSGANNTIDKKDIAQLDFVYDPRTVENNAAWYLDSIRLVAPNANLPGSVPYDDLSKSLGGSASPGTTKPPATTTASAGGGTTTTARKTDGTTRSTGAAGPGDTGTEPVNTEETGGTGETGGTTAGGTETGRTTDETQSVSEKKPGKSNTPLIIILVVVIVLAAGGGVVFLLRGKIFKKTDDAG